ncbi:MAG: acylphosphatase [Porphyromonadaceae bacterium]|nr:acylphosphatase [Porphyromonadaceae bacterium]
MKRFKQKETKLKVPSEQDKRYHIQFYGHVQQVGFRIQAYQIACQYDVTGWIKNATDGSVLMEIQGKTEDIKHILLKIHKIPSLTIDHMESKIISPIPEASFKIIGY